MSRTPASARGRVHAVVLAGGAGTRFWPLSREARPKPLMRISSGQSLLDQTLSRGRRFAKADDIWLVCGQEHSTIMRRAAGLPARRVLVEPRMRNTAPAVALAALRILAEDPEAVMVVLPADHRVPDERAFAAAIRKGVAAARDGDALVTLGVRPTRPDTGYGYIRTGKPVGRDHPGLRRVSRFVEKPGLAAARRYVSSGNYLWNAGIFVWKARTILDEIETHAPALHRALAPLRDALASGSTAKQLWGASTQKAYRRVPGAPIDTAILERSRRVWCLPVAFHWSDVGTWMRLAEELGVGANVTEVIEGEALLCDATRNLVRGHDRPIVLLGVEGLAVIDAGDAVLVADLERSGEVRDVVAQLRRQGRKDLL